MNAKIKAAAEIPEEPASEFTAGPALFPAA